MDKKGAQAAGGAWQSGGRLNLIRQRKINLK